MIEWFLQFWPLFRVSFPDFNCYVVLPAYVLNQKCPSLLSVPPQIHSFIHPLLRAIVDDFTTLRTNFIRLIHYLFCSSIVYSLILVLFSLGILWVVLNLKSCEFGPSFGGHCFLVTQLIGKIMNFLLLSDIHMKAKETNSNISGYGKPPWVFKGSAIYQLNLVKAETARAFIPREFRLVEAFGYTLGGFFLASYDDSPAGIFDELVVIAGIVWNPPTSCAWAARVLVNSDEACTHGRKDVGLPSQVARFSKSIAAIPKPKSKTSGFLNMFGMGTSSDIPTNRMDIQISETKGTNPVDFCNINLDTADFTMAAPELKSSKWMGPVIKMSLPSFSGRTEHNPHLLTYSCQIECRVRPASPAKVSRPSELQSDRERHFECQNSDSMDSLAVETKDYKRNLSISVLLSKPILALQFNCLKMQVESPVVVSQNSHNS